MKALHLVTFPAQCLRRRTKKVIEFSEDLVISARKMADIMYLNRGIGLAATQVGIDMRLMVADSGDGEGLLVMINPEIVDRSSDTDAMEEGCLSLPGVTVKVRRPKQVEVKALDLYGKEFSGIYAGLMAKVLQHEIDHLEGVLLIDYLDPVRKFVNSRNMAIRKKRTTAVKE
ncbi:MAG: peptide deformylase [Candidatus Omnitrophica bacterium]|nr:peptide deformylase [Candidatus Omnitrophota bacterium]